MRNLFAFAAVALVCAACTNPAALSEDDEVSVEKQRVTFKFSPYTVTSMGAKANHAPKTTRATVPVSSVVNHLDVWLMEGDSTTALAKHESVAESHQTVADDGFGSLSLTLDKSKTYTLYAVGHKESAPTTLSTGVVSFPDTKKSQTLYYSSTFTPAKTTKLNCKMLRAVGMFRIIIEDEIPSEVKKMEITAGETPTQWSFPQHAGITPTDTYSVSWSSFKHEDDGTTMFSIYILGSDTEKHYSVTVSAYGADDSVLKSLTFTDVPIRNNYRTIYTGSFFKDTPFSSTFQVEEDWQDYDEVEY